MNAHTHTLRRFTSTGILLVLSAIFFSACLDDSSTTTAVTNGCYISKVAFTYLKQTMTVTKHKTGSAGQDSTYDSTYYYSYSASEYAFTIDQIKNEIYNRDSVLYGTRISKVPLSLTYTGATAFWRSVDAWESDPWTAFVSGDTLDFTSAINMRITATDGSQRIYRIHVNMHSSDGDTLRWTAAPDCSAFTCANRMKAFTLKNAPAVMVSDGSTLKLYTLSGSTWTGRAVNGLGSDVDLNTLCTAGASIKPGEIYFRDSLFYMSNHNGDVYVSDDAQNWVHSTVIQEDGVKLIGASDTCLYAVRTDGGVSQLKCCNLKQYPLQFRNEKLDADEDASLMPSDSIMWASYWQNNDYNVRRLLILGSAPDGSHNAWTKSWITDLYSSNVHVENEVDEVWMRYNRTWDDIERLPSMKNIQMLHYDDYLIAFGGPTYDGKTQALDSIYSSRDNGLTWQRNETLPITAAVKSSYDGQITATVADDILWLFTGGKVWRGVLAKLKYEHRDFEL